MNSVPGVFVLLLLPLLVSSQIQNLLGALARCGKNEILSRGLPCVETCASKPQVCAQVYKIGCFCKEGYVRQSDADGSPCVKRAECKQADETQACGDNEEYSTCGTSCAPTCYDLRYPVPKPPRPCIALCRSGCFCKKGYYRSEEGTCVPPEQCCGENERYQACGSACAETCDAKPAFCTKECVPGCFCGCSGYVRKNNSTGSACIHRDDCPKSEECEEED